MTAVVASGTRAAASGTRGRLLQAARELIEEGGYAGASVAAIAARSGLAAGTLYRHFRSKEELFVEVFRVVCAREEQAVRRATDELAPGTPAVARLQAMLTTFARRALRNPRLAWALLAEPVDPLVDAERLAYRARYTRLIEAGVTAGIAAGELPTQNAMLTAAALVGACGESLVGPLSPLGAGADPEEVVEAVRVLVHRAVGAR